jgi:hypothetical protein
VQNIGALERAGNIGKFVIGCRVGAGGVIFFGSHCNLEIDLFSLNDIRFSKET